METTEIIREIGKMPFYQVEFKQKTILQMFKNGEIPQGVIRKAIELIKKRNNEQ